MLLSDCKNDTATMTAEKQYTKVLPRGMAGARMARPAHRAPQIHEQD